MLLTKRLWCYYIFLSCYLVFQLFFSVMLKAFNKDTHTNAIKVSENYKKLIMQLNQSVEVDSTGLYKIIPVKITGSKKNDITIVSQCSSNHFPLVDDLFNAWEGPISIAIYSEPKHVPKCLLDMAKFLHCYKEREFVMTLVIPNEDLSNLEYEYGFDRLEEYDGAVSCQAPYVSSFIQKRNYNWNNPFPVNLLRNIAKAGSTTDFVLVIDIDMLPNYNLHKNFLQFVNNGESDFEKTVYVIPVFETNPSAPIPEDKEALRQLIKQSKAQPFYTGPCKNCQKLTNYTKWLERSKAGVKVLHKLQWKHPWEPFVITKRNAPNFDERFRQYGYNRVSQLCEIHMAGYDFAVLDNAFLVHKGFKKLDDFHKTKDEEMKANRMLYNRFKFQIRFKYPETDRIC